MTRYSLQSPSAVLMIRPQRFSPNLETAADNRFQTSTSAEAAALAAAAQAEVDDLASRLRGAGVRVHMFDELPGAATPDCVFPNNWISTHPGGRIALYPMCAESRRRERRPDVVEMLKREYRVQEVIDYSALETDGLYLEGTGAMVLDHIGGIAYVSRSRRANEIVLERFCAQFGFEPLAFETSCPDGGAVYHTNVMMSVGTHLAMVGFDHICDPQRRDEVRARLEETGREVIGLSLAQTAAFAGNCLELATPGGPVLAISRRGREALTAEQVRRIERHADILDVATPTIELAGGSVRCMLAGIHLHPRPGLPQPAETPELAELDAV